MAYKVKRPQHQLTRFDSTYKDFGIRLIKEKERYGIFLKYPKQSGFYWLVDKEYHNIPDRKTALKLAKKRINELYYYRAYKVIRF